VAALVHAKGRFNLMRTLRTGTMVLALILSGCGNAPVTTYPPSQTTQPTYQQTYQAPQQPQQQAAPQQQAPIANQQQVVAQPIATGPGNFSARFIDKKNGQPVQGLEVTIVGSGDKKVTDADGKVSFDGVPANAQYKTYHNDFVQVIDKVQVGMQATIPLTEMAELTN